MVVPYAVKYSTECTYYDYHKIWKTDTKATKQDLLLLPSLLGIYDTDSFLLFLNPP